MWRSSEGLILVDESRRQWLRLGNPAQIAGLTVLSLSAPAAFAQTADQGTPPPPQVEQLQEVVVTAQFRSENVQQTPLAITAINSATLEQRGQTSITQIAADAPSVSLAPNTTAFGPTMTAFIRGIGQGDNDPALEPGVGIYIDDVFFGTTTGSLLDLLDLDRVEVLRGPQGTLEGMNSLGGAVKLFSKQPDATPSTNFDALYGSRNHVEFRAGTNFALSDNLFLRVSGVGNFQDGYVDVVDFGCRNPTVTATAIGTTAPATYTVLPGFTTRDSSCTVGQEGGTGYVGGRVSLRWLVSDRLEATFSADLTNENQENPADVLLRAAPIMNPDPRLGLQVTNTATGAAASLPYNSMLVPAMIPTNHWYTYTTLCMPALAAYTAQPFGPMGPSVPVPAQAAACNDNRTTLSNWGTMANVTWTINDSMSLKSITSYRGYESQWYEDNDASPWPLGLGADSIDHHQMSEELRLNGTVPHVVDWTLGAFYFYEKSVYATHQDLWYAGGPGVLNFIQDDPILAHDRAAFLHTVWHLTSQLDLTAGVRYTSQDKDYHFVRIPAEAGLQPGLALFGLIANPVTGTAGVNNQVGHYAADRTDYRGNLAFHFNDQMMVYGQVSTGFKGGGIDPRPFNFAQVVAFRPETLTNYEAGIKSTWLENRLRVNLDGYYSEYNNIQLTLNNCTGLPGNPAGTLISAMNGAPCALPFNAGNAHEYGAELETQLRLGGFQADLSADYLSFNYTNLFFASGVVKGMTTPFTPKEQGNLGLQYTIPYTTGSFTARVEGNTRSQVFTNAVNAPINRIGGYTVFNARAWWDSPKQDWQIAVAAQNFTGKQYLLNIFDLSAAGGGSTTGVPAPPMELDLEIKHKM